MKKTLFVSAITLAVLSLASCSNITDSPAQPNNAQTGSTQSSSIFGIGSPTVECLTEWDEHISFEDGNIVNNGSPTAIMTYDEFRRSAYLDANTMYANTWKVYCTDASHNEYVYTCYRVPADAVEYNSYVNNPRNPIDIRSDATIYCYR